MYKEIYVNKNKQVTLYYKTKENVKCFVYDGDFRVQKTAINTYQEFRKSLDDKGYLFGCMILIDDDEFPEEFLNEK